MGKRKKPPRISPYERVLNARIQMACTKHFQKLGMLDPDKAVGKINQLIALWRQVDSAGVDKFQAEQSQPIQVLNLMCYKHDIKVNAPTWGKKSSQAPTQPKRALTAKCDVKSDAFLLSYEWRKVRMVALVRDGARCACCGATPRDGAQMNVDHIKPRRLFPDLALDPNNLQVLCHECNHGKGNWDSTDWRGTLPPEKLELDAQFKEVMGRTE